MPLHPPIEPYDTGVLTTDDGQALYWETCGNPNGRPVLYLHGGPGSGCSAGARRYFDPERYRIVLFDQRGCGRSRPLPTDPDVDLERTQTTQLLLDDIERLRELLAIPSWVVKGGSWGSTLALAYAQAHPQRVEALLLAAVATTTEREVRWITEDMRRIFPAEWDRFAEAVPAPLRGTRLVDAYATLLADPDPAVREHAAREWCRWEDVHVSLAPGHRPSSRYEDPAFRARRSRGPGSPAGTGSSGSWRCGCRRFVDDQLASMNHCHRRSGHDPTAGEETARRDAVWRDAAWARWHHRWPGRSTASACGSRAAPMSTTRSRSSTTPETPSVQVPLRGAAGLPATGPAPGPAGPATPPPTPRPAGVAVRLTTRRRQ